MNTIPLWVQFLIAILGSGTVGAIAGAVSTTLTSRVRLKELDITHQQQQHEIYLKNAREHIADLYLPLNISLSDLADKYERYATYRRTLMVAMAVKKGIFKNLYPSIPEDLRTRSVKEGAAFRVACDNYCKTIDSIFADGRDAYLTVELEERLRSFTWLINTVRKLPEATQAEDQHMSIASAQLIIGSLKFMRLFDKDMPFLKSCIKEVTLGKEITK